MYRFHVAIHAAPPEPLAIVPITFHKQTLDALNLHPSQLTGTLPITFEQAATALEQLPRMSVEPDGSFVWVAEHNQPPWQVDGLLVDRGGRLSHVELKGTCPAAQFDRLLSICGWPAASVVFQLVRAAVFLSESAFREWAEGEG